MSDFARYFHDHIVFKTFSTSGINDGVGLQYSEIDVKSVTSLLSVDGGCLFTMNEGLVFSTVTPISCGRENIPAACRSSNLFWSSTKLSLP